MFRFPSSTTNTMNDYKSRFRKPSRNFGETTMSEYCQQRIGKHYIQSSSFYPRYSFPQDRSYGPIRMTFTSVHDIEIIEMSNTGCIISVDRWKRIGGGFL